MNASDVLALARPEIRELKPYVSARMEVANAALPLDANELPWSPGLADQNLNRYPAPQPPELRARLAGLYGVGDDQLLMTRGSGEGIDLLLRAFCRAHRDAVMVCPPTFGLYAVRAAVQGAAVIELPSNPTFEPSPRLMSKLLDDRVKLVFVCSPNNPTGNLLPLGSVCKLADLLAGRALLVVDEAYIEFAGTPSAATLLDPYSHLVVLRTLSKAWGLAGARIGALLAHTEIVSLLRRILAPYPLAAPAIAAALVALQDPDAMKARVAELRRERERVAKTLAGLANVNEVLSTDANFLAVRFRDAGQAMRRLAAAGIAVRDLRGYPRLGDALRISIGTPEQDDCLLAALERSLPLQRVAL